MPYELLKKVFGDKALTLTELETALKDNKEIKLGNLAAGQYVDKAKLEAKVKELETANGTIGQLKDSIKKFDGVDIEKLKKDAADWETKYNADVSKLKMESALDLALVTGKAKNTKAVKALLDLEKIKMDGDKLLGLDDQLTKLKTDAAYLFDEAKKDESNAKVDSGKPHGGEPGAGAGDAAMRAAFGLPPAK